MKLAQSAALEIFGLTGKITPILIKTKYRVLCKQYHPDRNPSGLEMMQMINSAYDTLKLIQEDIEHTEDESNYCDSVSQAIAAIVGLELDIEICGSWVWVGGDTRTHKEALKAAGFRWSSKKKLWHFRPADDNKKRYRGKTSMKDIRGKYGSNAVKTIKRRAIAA